MDGDALVFIARDGYAAAFVRDNYAPWLQQEARALEPGIRHVRVIEWKPALVAAGAP